MPSRFLGLANSPEPRTRVLSNPPIPPKHLSDFLTERYALGRITSGVQLEKIEEHIGSCHECRKQVERLDAVRILRQALHRLKGGATSNVFGGHTGA